VRSPLSESAHPTRYCTRGAAAAPATSSAICFCQVALRSAARKWKRRTTGAGTYASKQREREREELAEAALCLLDELDRCPTEMVAEILDDDMLTELADALDLSTD